MAMSIGIPLIVVTFVVMMFLIGVSGWIAIGLAELVGFESLPRFLDPEMLPRE